MRPTIYVVPQWFFGIDILLEVIFALTAGLVAWYAFEIYRMADKRESKLLGIGFALISASYIMRGILNLFVLHEIQEGVRELSLSSVTFLGMTGIYLYWTLFTSGLITLVYMTAKVKNTRLYALLLLTTLTLLLMSNSPAISFGIISALFSLSIFLHYIVECHRNHNQKTMLIAASFGLLFASDAIPLILEGYMNPYVAGHILEFGSYLLLLLILFLTVRRGKRA